MADGLPGGTSFMEDYTYHLVPGEELILGAHMLEVCPSIAAAKPTLEIHPLGIGDREDPVRLVFDAAPGGAVDPGHLRPRRPLPLRRQRGRGRRAQPSRCRDCRSLAPSGGPRPICAPPTECWLTAGGPHHTVLSTALNAEHLVDLADMVGTELVLIDADTTVRRLRQELRWNQAYHRLAQGF